MSSSGNFILIPLPDYTNRCLNKKIYIKKKSFFGGGGGGGGVRCLNQSASHYTDNMGSLQLVFHARKNNNNRKEVAGGVVGRLLF